MLQSLVDKSLLRHTGDRFWMLETIREFAVERLQHLAETSDILERHAQWYLRLAKSAHGALHGAGQEEWLVRLDSDLENLRSAIGWAWNNDEHLQVELAGATWYFLSVRGLLREALGYLVHALETAQKDLSLDQSELLYGSAYVAVRTGDYAAVERWSEQRLELGRARGDAPVIALSLVGLALAARFHRGDRERARTLYREAAKVARDCGDTLTLGIVVHNLGNIALEEGDAETARMHLQQALELDRELSDTRDEALVLVGLSLVALLESDIDEAAALLGSSLRLAGSLGDQELIFGCLMGSAEVAARRGETVRAARLLGAADALREEIGYASDPLDREQRARIAAVLGDDATLVSAQSQGRALTIDDAVAYALGEHD